MKYTYSLELEFYMQTILFVNVHFIAILFTEFEATVIPYSLIFTLFMCFHFKVLFCMIICSLLPKHEYSSKKNEK